MPDAIIEKRTGRTGVKVFSTSPEAFEEFVNRLNAPPQPNDRLRRTLATKAPWDMPERRTVGAWHSYR